jgi:hypothetical protein
MTVQVSLKDYNDSDIYFRAHISKPVLNYGIECFCLYDWT